MKIIRNSLKNEFVLRTEKDFPTEGVEFIDINPLIINKDTFEEIIDRFVEYLNDTKIDYIVSPESRGFVFGGALAKELNVGFVPVRKKGKLPPSTIIKTFEYEKEYGHDELQLPKLPDGDYRLKKFFILDDIYATGSTVKSIVKAIAELGGNIVGVGAVLNIIELNNDDVFSLIEVNES